MSKRRGQRIPQGLYTATVHNLSHEGRGVAHIEGKTTFISGALQGETVEFHYTKSHGRFDEGRLDQVVASANTHRATPPCPHFALCGGCSLQHVEHDEQLRLKQTWVAEQFDHIAKAPPHAWMPTLEGPIFGYRRKARLSLKWVEKKGGLILGFHEKDYGHFVTPIEKCMVLHPKVGEHLTEIRDLIGSLSVAMHIPQLEVAVGDDHSAIVVRHTEPFTPDDQAKLIAFGDTHQFKIFSQAAGPDSIRLLNYPDDSPLLRYRLEAFNLDIYFHPTDFTQVNFGMNQAMVAKAVEWLDPQPTDTILDLFCGLGNFTLALATRAKHVVGVEGSAVMVERAQLNAERNHITNCEFHAADLTKPMTPDWAQRHYDKILLDPARTGAQEIVQLIDTWSPERIVYVSCNPATLARDTDILVNQHGYEFQSAGIMDMFPHTTHVETMAVFTRKSHGKN